MDYYSSWFGLIPYHVLPCDDEPLKSSLLLRLIAVFLRKFPCALPKGANS